MFSEHLMHLWEMMGRQNMQDIRFWWLMLTQHVPSICPLSWWPFLEGFTMAWNIVYSKLVPNMWLLIRLCQWIHRIKPIHIFVVSPSAMDTNLVSTTCSDLLHVIVSLLHFARISQAALQPFVGLHHRPLLRPALQAFWSRQTFGIAKTENIQM